MIKIFQKTSESDKTKMVHETFRDKERRKHGIANGKTLIAEGYDFDECNDEIAEMFGLKE